MFDMRVFEVIIITFILSYTLCSSHSADGSAVDKLTRNGYLEGRADMIFLLDRSGSVGFTNFEIQKGFVESLLMHVVVDANATRVAIVSYSTTPKLHVDYIRKPKSKCLLSLEMQDIVYDDSGATDIAAALEVARMLFTYGRPNVNKVVILISDGMATHGADPVPVAKQLREETGAELFSFGIGKFLKTQLHNMASSDAHVHVCSGFKEFKKLARRIRGDPHESKWSLESNSAPNCDHLCDSPYKDEPDDPGCCDHHARCSCALLSGMHNCVCNPGYYGLLATWGKCKECPRGTYKPGIEPSPSCTPCPHHAITASSASASITDCYCKEGYQGSPAENVPCTAVTCPPLQNPSNGVLLGNCKNDFGSTCSFMCNQGYQLIDSHTDILICQSNGQWSTDVPVCRQTLCAKPLRPDYGEIVCSNSVLTVGSKCRFSCSRGFYLNGSKERECLPNRKWSGIEVRCKPTECRIPQPLLYGKILNCGALTRPTLFQSCAFHCIDGYKLIGPKAFYCSYNGKLENNGIFYDDYRPICIDIQRPEIHCPESKEYQCDAGKSYAVVSWELPEAYDNSGELPMVYNYPHNIIPPARFPIGTFSMQYKAVDKSGLSETCNFTITVIDQEKPMVIYCPSTFILDSNDYGTKAFWDEPVFKDNSDQSPKIGKSHTSGDFFQIGSHFVNYVATDRSGNSAFCEFKIIINQNQCPYYPAPINGALACEDWMYGQFCQVYCNDQYDFMSKPAEWYICNHDAKWSTDPFGYPLPWPHCYRKALPNRIRQTLKGFYYSGDCNNPNVQYVIKRSFIQQISTKIKDCESKGICILENIRVTCGKAYNVRQKRDLQQEKRNFKIEIGFSLDSVEEEEFESFGEILESFELENFNFETSFGNESDAFSEMLNNTIEFGNMEMTSKEIQFDCDPGSILLWHVCMLCPPGTFHNKSTNECEECAVGHYQNEEGQLECNECASGFTTLNTQSANESDCRRICSKGTYSADGLETCMVCPLGTYQSNEMQTYCSSCPNDTTTTTEAATSAEDCRNYCPEGSFSESHVKPCLLCPIGFYQSLPAQTSCIECELELTTIQEGSSFPSDCIAYNPCDDSFVCMNGGICNVTNRAVSCTCASGYTGKHCEEDIDECLRNPCSDRGICLNYGGSFHCECNKGLTGKFCEDEINECSSQPCFNNGTCLDEMGDYLCICDPEYSGKDCEVKIEINGTEITCLYGNEWEIDHLGGQSCKCATGFAGSDCSITLDNCYNVTCYNGGSCINGFTEYHCSCVSGYEGEYCQLKIDECRNHSCFGGSTCVGLLGHYECYCPPGWTGVLCETKMNSDFVLHFPLQPSLENMAWIRLNSSLIEVTISFWIQTYDTDKKYGTPLSYAVQKQSSNGSIDDTDVTDNALTITGLPDADFYINNEIISVGVQMIPNEWHHLVFTWTSNLGECSVYFDGKSIYNTQGIQPNVPIFGGGYLVVGQEQDNIMGGFNILESFSGNITRLNIWNKVLPPSDVIALTSLKDDIPGKVVDWSDFRNNVYGNVILLENKIPYFV